MRRLLIIVAIVGIAWFIHQFRFEVHKVNINRSAAPDNEELERLLREWREELWGK